ncbi:MAG: histidine kinase [Flavobacteriaceae bacterium]|nr:histidine kinase [Flavobacteriaceae bacterium]|tara:strand:- start:229553 stop:233629 length:4077 start_codon:yes stop_codon:yes gene_type:complete
MANEKDFYVVAIGASAGGLEAVQTFFDHIPKNTGAAYVVIQHLSPDFKSLMPELLSKHTHMKIFTAEHGQKIKPNCVYLNNRNNNIGIENDQFVLIDKDPKEQLNLPIDIFFHMVGKAFKEKSIGVILSGTGSDGSRGIKTIKEEMGTIFVQDPDTAQFDGMPNSSILTNLPDFILPVENMAETIVNYTKNSSKHFKALEIDDVETASLDKESTFQTILSVIYKHTDVNFKKYKVNTLLRRLEKRMNLHNIKTLEDYLRFLISSDEEKEAINNEFLIGVTSFFRDKKAYEVMREKVVPELCNKKGNDEVIRIWVPGCSSGEEVYSLAILFEDYIQRNRLNISYKIFATDIDKKALNFASMGNYPINNAEDIDKEILERYFLKSGGNLEITNKVREKIIFSYHDVTKDPPFIKVDLISCRNLLIYLSNETQKTVLAGFQFSLNQDGVLFLGSSESLGPISNLFSIIDNKYKIYQNLKAIKRINKGNKLYTYSKMRTINPLQGLSLKQQNQSSTKHSEAHYYKILSQKHAPVSVFVDKECNVEFMVGDFKKWFNQSDGSFSSNLYQMVSQELATVIKNGLRKVDETKSSVEIKNLVYKNNGEDLVTNLYFEVAENPSLRNQKYLIQFGEGEISKAEEQIILSDNDVSNFSKQRIESLEQELKQKSHELQNIVEELETSNEELQSSNEELMSSNEELQSSNEELQSVNEELYTVNSEFQEKNRELEDLNNDMNNLLTSSDIGTLFLDAQLNIRKYTPEIKKVFNLEPSDIGRSLTSFTSNFNTEIRKTIIDNARRALDDLKTFENEVQDIHGNWYLKRISPFVTLDKKIDGVVIAFVRINQLKEKEEELKRNRFHLNKAQAVTKVGSWYLDVKTNEITWTKEMYKMFEMDYMAPVPSFSEHKKFWTESSWKLINSSIENAIANATPYQIEVEMESSIGTNKWLWAKGEPLQNEDGEVYAIWGVSQDITERKQQELRLIEAQQKAETANIYKNQFLANMSHEIRTPMNGLLGFANMLRKDDLDVETRNSYVDIIESCTKQLLNLTNDIIDISKIEAGELQINKGSCHLGNLFRELETTFNEIKKQDEKHQVKLRTIIPKSLDNLVVESDATRLKQVLSNLIDNALKFTQKGLVEFGYNVHDSKLIITVSDTGLGMSKDKLTLIFERFQRLENKDSAKTKGTGLGLTISKGIVDLLGGTIDVQSELGKGSTFTITLPHKKVSKTKKSEKTKKRTKNNTMLDCKKILVAEDDYANRLFLKEILKDLPVQTIWAKNGEEAVEKFVENEDICITLMDIRMPILDGYEATKQILKVNPKAKIIAQTSYAMTSDKERCLQEGFVDYITKPIDNDVLIETMKKWVTEEV